MSLVKDGFIVISPGETLTGRDAERDVLVNTELEGREGYIEYGSSKRMTKVRIMRNTSGAALLPGEIATVDASAGVAELGKASAKSSAADRFTVVVDPDLPAAGVADDDLFLAFVKGPAKVKSPSSAFTPAVAQQFEAGASGRLQAAAVDGSDSEQIMGTLLADDTEIPAGTLVDCVLHPHWE